MGLWEQDDHVHNDPDGYGIARHMQQLMESYIQLMKRECRNRCNKLAGWLLRLHRFSDCYTVGAMGYDLIDLKHPMRKYLKEMSLIYLPTSTPLIEGNLVTSMPGRFIYYLSLMEQVETHHDPIPPLLIEAWNRHVSRNHDLDNLRAHIGQACEMDRGEDFSGWLESVDGQHDILIRRRKVMGRAQWMQELCNRMHDLNDSDDGNQSDNPSVSSADEQLLFGGLGNDESSDGGSSHSSQQSNMESH